MTKEIKTIILDPHAFDDFEGTQEELDALLAEITEFFSQPDFEKHTRQLSNEEAEQLEKQIEQRQKRKLAS